MKFHSTRDFKKKFSLSQAIQMGLCEDGGLFIPESFPKVVWDSAKTDKEIISAALSPFFAGDVLEKDLPEIIEDVFSFPLEIKEIDDQTSILELFHGPTCAFKDFGARFLAACLERLGSEKKLVLVATSGDTGSAVASAFYQRKGIVVGLLFPKGRISPRQRQQLVCWGENIRSFEVEGAFDDCQRVVKECFKDNEFVKKTGLTSANSINIARLLPQMSYYAIASVKNYRERGSEASFVIPSGNLGNAVAAFYCKEIGFPIGRIDLSTNANGTIEHYYKTGENRPASSVTTLANAMDVGAPSNLERLQALHTVDQLREISSVQKVSDNEIKSEIQNFFHEKGEVLCPHTATAAFFSRNHPAILVATAHPAKFESIVEPLIDQEVEVPPSLTALLEKEENYETIAADSTALKSQWT